MDLSLIQENRKDTKCSKLLRRAKFQGWFEFPVITTCDTIPQNIIAFDDAMSAKDHNKYNKWVHFYIYDDEFERIWTQPERYLKVLRKYQGVISPDFSVYRDAPLGEQFSNTFRNRALGYWLSSKGVRVIPNVRWGDERSYSFCFDGIEPDKTVAIGTHGCIKKSDDRYYYKLGLDAMVHRLRPKRIIVYGDAPHDLFSPHMEEIEIIPFKSQFHLSRQKEAV